MTFHSWPVYICDQSSDRTARRALEPKDRESPDASRSKGSRRLFKHPLHLATKVIVTMVRVLFALALCVATVSAFVAPANHAGELFVRIALAIWYCHGSGIAMGWSECDLWCGRSWVAVYHVYTVTGIFEGWLCYAALTGFFGSLQSLRLPTLPPLRPRWSPSKLLTLLPPTLHKTPTWSPPALVTLVDMLTPLSALDFWLPSSSTSPLLWLTSKCAAHEGHYFGRSLWIDLVEVLEKGFYANLPLEMVSLQCITFPKFVVRLVVCDQSSAGYRSRCFDEESS